MSCERCEVLPAHPSPHYVLLATSHPGTRNHILDYLQSSRFPAAGHALGVRLEAQGERWREGLVLLADVLTGPERHDVRACLVPEGDDTMALPRAILAAHTLEGMIHYLGHEWLLDLLGREALHVEFQAVIGHRPPRVVGYECLLRGESRTGQRVRPGELYEAAQALDLVHYLDRQARLLAIAAADQLQRGASGQLLFFIHFPPDAIFTPRPCLDATLAAVRDSALSPEQIVFEAPDVEHLADREHLARVFGALREEGFRLALGNVRGHGSMALLSEIRPDYIRLDGEFVHRAADLPLEARLLRDVLAMAAQHHAAVVACGIEHARELEFAAAMGITMSQGYCHAHPQAGPLAEEQWERIRQEMSHLTGDGPASEAG